MICPVCGEAVVRPTGRRTVYCGPTCRRRVGKKRELARLREATRRRQSSSWPRWCARCGVEFNRPRFPGARFCSASCSHRYNVVSNQTRNREAANARNRRWYLARGGPTEDERERKEAYRRHRYASDDTYRERVLWRVEIARSRKRLPSGWVDRVKQEVENGMPVECGMALLKALGSQLKEMTNAE